MLCNCNVYEKIKSQTNITKFKRLTFYNITYQLLLISSGSLFVKMPHQNEQILVTTGNVTVCMTM